MLQSNFTIPSPANALPGRTEAVLVAKQHYV